MGLAPPLLGLLFMAAVFGAAARMPRTASVFAVEVTADAHALPDSVLSGQRVRRGWHVVQDAIASCPAAGDPFCGGGGGRPGGTMAPQGALLVSKGGAEGWRGMRRRR
jgi:hypothetical protein